MRAPKRGAGTCWRRTRGSRCPRPGPRGRRRSRSWSPRGCGRPAAQLSPGRWFLLLQAQRNQKSATEDRETVKSAPAVFPAPSGRPRSLRLGAALSRCKRSTVRTAVQMHRSAMANREANRTRLCSPLRRALPSLASSHALLRASARAQTSYIAPKTP